MSQTFLDENPPMILDATCSYARIWPAHASLRMDIRKEVRPDLVADAKFLPFRDGVFDTIFCDPPHLIRKSINRESLRASRFRHPRFGQLDMFARYGFWISRKDWLEFAAASSLEFARILKLNGELRYKITDTSPNRTNKDDVTLFSELLEATSSSFKIEKDVTTLSNSRTGNGSKVHWLTMRPKP